MEKKSKKLKCGCPMQDENSMCINQKHVLCTPISDEGKESLSDTANGEVIMGKQGVYTPPDERKEAKCEICGHPMPKGEGSFRYHGYSCPCPEFKIKKTNSMKKKPKYNDSDREDYRDSTPPETPSSRNESWEEEFDEKFPEHRCKLDWYDEMSDFQESTSLETIKSFISNLLSLKDQEWERKVKEIEKIRDDAFKQAVSSVFYPEFNWKDGYSTGVKRALEILNSNDNLKEKK